MKPNGRRVVLICGPPGAGKTTLARSIAESQGLDLYDRDDPEWSSERQFAAALKRLGRSRSARAVVIRSGATRLARGRAAQMVDATEIRVVATPLEECRRRIRRRKRPGNMRREMAAAKKWWRTYEPGEPIRPAPPKPKGSTVARGYGAHHQALRRRWEPKVAAGVVRCARCGEPIEPGEPWDLGHVDGSRRAYQGPEHRRCNRATSAHRKERESRKSREW